MKKVLSLLLVLALVFCFAACGNDTPATDGGDATADEPVTIVMGNVTADNNPYALTLFRVQDNLEAAGSTVTLDAQIGGVLGSETEMAQNTALGVIDGVQCADMSTTGVAPKMSFSNLPGLFPDYDSMREAWKAGGKCFNAASDIYAEQGIKFISAGDNGFRCVSNSVRPVEKIEDIAGLKIRVPENELLLEIWEKMGAITCPIAYGELAAALQQGTVDGQELYSSFYSLRFDEFQPYLTLLNYDYSAHVCLMNQAKWDSLSEQQQTDVMDAFAEAEAWDIEYAEGFYADGLEVMIEETGLQVIEATDDMKAYFKAMGKELCEEEKWNSLYGQEIIDMLGF